MNKESKQSRSIIRTPFLGIIILTVVITGLVVDVTKADSDNFYADIIRLDNVVKRVHENYVEEMSSKALVDNAIEGMLEILDPHTSYFEAKQYEELRIHTEGKFGGLGIQISIRNDVLTVMTPISGTPAARAGIQSGDQIVKIDGKSTKGITIDKAVGKLRGEPNSKVTITIRRKGEVKDIDYTITREVIRIKSVPYYGVVVDSIGYIHLQTFSQEAGSEVEKAIKELLAKDIKGLVFDLRHNPGGLLPQAIEVAEKFLPKKSLVVSTRGRVRGQNKEYLSGSRPVLPDEFPLAVLVDYASASASEIVAGAIQDWDRGIVIGDTTFGKGSVQTILPLDKEHHLKLTTAFYYTPSGRCINRPENDIRGSADDESEGEEGMLEEMEGDNSGTDDDDGASTASDSTDSTTFKTKNGRTVFGGGGIIPDSVVEQEKLTGVIRAMLVKDVFFQFANLEYPRLKKRKVKIGPDYSVDEKTINDFYTFLDSIDFNYESLAEIKFQEFRKRVGLQDTSDTTKDTTSVKPFDTPTWSNEVKTKLQEIAGQMELVLQSQSKKALKEDEKKIKRHVREALLVRVFGQDHEVYYREKLENDNQLKSTLKLIANLEKYNSFLLPRMVGKASLEKKKNK